MVINYCPNCEGRPYTTDSSLDTCPRCGHQLQSEFVFPQDLEGRPTLSAGGATATHRVGRDLEENTRTYPFARTSSQGLSNTLPLDGVWDDQRADISPTREAPAVPTNTTHVTPMTPAAPVTSRPPVTSTRPVTPPSQRADGQVAPGTTIRGKVANYSNSEAEAGMYRRFFVQRLVDAVVYGQRMEDLVHRFTVRVSPGGTNTGAYVDVPVNVHGTISGGMQLVNNSEVEVTGRYRNGVLMARKVAVINGNSRTYVRFQRSVGAMVIAGLVLALVAFLASGGIDLVASLAGGLGSFVVTWLGVSAIVAVIWAVVLSHMGTVAQIMLLRGNFPLIGILGVGLIITLAMTNALGLGAAASALGDGLLEVLATIAGPALTLAAIIYLLGLMFR